MQAAADHVVAYPAQQRDVAGGQSHVEVERGEQRRGQGQRRVGLARPGALPAGRARAAYPVLGEHGDDVGVGVGVQVVEQHPGGSLAAARAAAAAAHRDAGRHQRRPHSADRSPQLFSDLLERPPLPVEHGGAARQALPGQAGQARGEGPGPARQAQRVQSAAQVVLTDTEPLDQSAHRHVGSAVQLATPHR